MKTIDSFLIECLFEPFSHFVQKWTGFDNFGLAKVITWASIACILLAQVFGIDTPTFVIIFTCYFLYIIYFHIPSVEEKVYRDLPKGCKNYLVESQRLNRSVGLVLNFIYGLIALRGPWWLVFLMGSSVVYLLATYFFTCTPLPPGKSKIRELLDQLKEVMDQLGGLPSPT